MELTKKQSLAEKWNDLLIAANYRYSRLWIAMTGLSKHEYRDWSLVHKALISLILMPA